ncbi:MaoC family dehydratase N-terminal domain-containing protein [Bacillus sp. ISL-7]|uniref:MaoC family dehydratase N-terminal domain-containing protein n=1 Tax=Bacillus sp. ISL-7 TaxID=2819136 RepID=UPI001BECE0C8|nr:MaoC family dehydratase N-terminal domain-containing protein [Bacillus sp. ISL-7]MBT2737289.1 MaoC family dehydratase N-terminal domain-containing protein [Bacillus sp. ISL-7]
MSDVKDLLGYELEPYSMVVEKGKIKELAIAIGDDNPVYYSLEAAKEAGYEGIPVPLTFLQIIDYHGGYGFQEKMEALNLNPVKILHGGQEYEYLGDIYAGDELQVMSKIVWADTKIGSLGGMDFITEETRYTNQKGELVAIAKITLIHCH